MSHSSHMRANRNHPPSSQAAMITAPYNQPFTCTPASTALPSPSTAWTWHFLPPIIPLSHTTLTPSDHVHYVQSSAQRNDPAAVLEALDHFAATTQSLTSSPSFSSLNPKAELLVDEVLLPFTPSHHPSASNPLIMLEPLGVSSLGYSAIWFTTLLAARFGRANVRYIALEMDPERAYAAQQIVLHAGLADVIHVTLGSVREWLKDEAPARVDLLLLMKPAEERGRGGSMDALYMSETWRLMESGRLLKGSTVIADNMMDLGASAYGRWAETHQGLESRRYELVVGDTGSADGEEEVDAVQVSVVL